MNKIPKILKLKNNHPTMIKFNKLCDFAEELGLSLDLGGNFIILEDRDRDDNLPMLELHDLENDTCPSIPPTMEFKIIYDNPEYLEYEKKQSEIMDKERLEKNRLEKLKQDEELRIRKEKEAKQIEDNERKQLAILKAKYENSRTNL